MNKNQSLRCAKFKGTWYGLYGGQWIIISGTLKHLIHTTQGVWIYIGPWSFSGAAIDVFEMVTEPTLTQRIKHFIYGRITKYLKGFKKT